MFKGSRALLAAAACAWLASCAGVDDSPLERLDLGTFIVVDFKMPISARGAAASGQRFLGKTVTLGPSDILFPAEWGQENCQHDGYRLSQRPVHFIQAFDLGSAGTLSVAEAEIADADLVEVWNSCLNGAFLSVDRQKLYLAGRGALLVLNKL